LLFISDPGVVIKPTVDQKVQITQHCIDTAHRLGVSHPRVAILAARDEVYPDELASSDAAALSKMAERGQITGAYVDGPLDLDSAISPVVVTQHGLHGPVAGRADILIVPDIEAGNILAKGLTYFARATSASVVVGAAAPIILTSRSDSAASKLASIALGVMLTRATPIKAKVEHYVQKNTGATRRLHPQ
jgi:phosphotransacetylase